MPKKLILSDDSLDLRAVVDSISNIEYRTGSNASSNVKIWTSNALTILGGTATFTLPTGYITTAHAIEVSVSRNVTSPVDYTLAFIKSETLPTIVVQAAESKTTGVVLGGVTEGLEPAPAGVKIYITVYGV